MGYWQELEVYNGQHQSKRRAYLSASDGKNLTYIPVEVVQTERKLAGKLQIEGGYLGFTLSQSSCSLSSECDLKERLRILQDTSYSSGWDESKKEEFDTINGRKYFAFGAGA